MALKVSDDNFGEVLYRIPAVDVTPDKGPHAVQLKGAPGKRNFFGDEAGKPGFELYRIADAHESFRACLQVDIAAQDGNGLQRRIFRRRRWLHNFLEFVESLYLECLALCRLR